MALLTEPGCIERSCSDSDGDESAEELALVSVIRPNQ